MPVLQASREYRIPRRTLRNHLATGSKKKKLGRYSLLNAEQERELCQRIFRLAEVGMPLTQRVLRRSVFSFAEEHSPNHGFSQTTRMAGRKWMHLFYQRHPEVVQRKAQALNPARALKLNRHIVTDYFQKLRKTLVDFSLINRPQCIYNMDEKGCRLTLHHQQKVLTRKGIKRVHLIAPEHAENVTVVACGNALGQAIPPMILFKGVRQKPEWIDSMPPGSVIEMTAKGSMTTAIFIKWVKHFSKFKAPGRCLLVFDGAASHLDAGIVEVADAAEISLLCLPSNTTHELQPLDKSVFRSFEQFWDEEVLNYWMREPDRKITKGRFGYILSKIWPKAMSPQNLMSGFRVTGIYPFNPDAIEEAAFAPSLLTEKPQERAEAEEDNPLTDDSELSDSDVLPLSILRNQGENQQEQRENLRPNKTPANYQQVNISHMEPKPSCSHWPENTDREPTPEPSTDDLLNSSSFSDLLPTPEIKTSDKPRRKALNSSAQLVTRDLFKTNLSATSSKKGKTNLSATNFKKGNMKMNKISDKKKNEAKESWYCFLCDRDEVLDMRKCCLCSVYVHEACVGLTKEEKLQFVCPRCSS
ncbi:tigger transposable element-derived protein 1-like isoform X2 [Anthonomus grandis grandis]|uniref:tigger transposable element-derived protein 1-like isoform X2 n=1 Tax=Anthonomus grandis grandis TaxID=2921223 RepID=UPI002164F589|nr:tigger transposable element-derived protein 1-like isoform X2 [Anthonomus grandis grandis]